MIEFAEELNASFHNYVTLSGDCKLAIYPMNAYFTRCGEVSVVVCKVQLNELE